MITLQEQNEMLVKIIREISTTTEVERLAVLADINSINCVPGLQNNFSDADHQIQEEYTDRIQKENHITDTESELSRQVNEESISAQNIRDPN